MPQKVLTRAKSLSDGKEDRIQLFVLFYLLKKYLYWGASSSRLAFSVNPRLAKFSALETPTMAEYMNKYNDTVSDSDKINHKDKVNSIGATANRFLGKLGNKFESIGNEIGEEWDQIPKQTQQLRDKLSPKVRPPATGPKTLVNRDVTPTKSYEDTRAFEFKQKKTRSKFVPSRVPAASKAAGGGKRTRKRRRLTKRIRGQRQTRKR